MRVDVIHDRDPDSACDITVYVDGRRVDDCHEWSFDPGSGWEMNDFYTWRDEALASAPDHLKPILAEMFSSREESFERWSV